MVNTKYYQMVGETITGQDKEDVKEICRKFALALLTHVGQWFEYSAIIDKATLVSQFRYITVTSEGFSLHTQQQGRRLYARITYTKPSGEKTTS